MTTPARRTQSRALPVLQWMSEYPRAWLRPDLIAGLTLAAYLLPAGIGDASLAGLPPEAGLYACLFGGLVFWIFCSSRQTVITVTSALSLLVGASVAELSGGDPARHAALAAAVAIMVAGKIWAKHRPIAFVVVVAGIAAARLFDLEAHGVSLLGMVPQGLPMPGLPMVSRADLNALLPTAFAAFLLGAVETS